MTTLRQEQKAVSIPINSDQILSQDELIQMFHRELNLNDEIADVCRLLPIINAYGKVPKELLDEKSHFVKQQVINIRKSIQLERFETTRQPISDGENQKLLKECLLTMSKDHHLLLLIIFQRFLRIHHAMITQNNTLAIRNQAKFFIAVYQSILSMLGVRHFTSIIEDTCFAVMSPKLYNNISVELEQNWPQKQRNLQLESAVETVNDLLRVESISATVTARTKSIFGIWRKKRKLKLKKFPTDILGLRIIVEDQKQCYSILGMLHSHFRHIPAEFDDYIGNPKENAYQSIHTVLLWKFERQEETFAVEVQIRTKSMDSIAKYGAAAHSSYKQGYIFGQRLERKLLNLYEIYAKENTGEFDTQQATDQLKLHIFAYTANKEMKALPENSSVLDFAYYIHSDIGNHFDYALVNNKLVHINTKLRHGDIVKIHTVKHPTVDKNWLINKYATTSRAKKQINSGIRMKENGLS